MRVCSHHGELRGYRQQHRMPSVGRANWAGLSLCSSGSVDHPLLLSANPVEKTSSTSRKLEQHVYLRPDSVQIAS